MGLGALELDLGLTWSWARDCGANWSKLDVGKDDMSFCLLRFHICWNTRRCGA